MPVDFLFPMFLSYPPSNCPWSNVQFEDPLFWSWEFTVFQGGHPLSSVSAGIPQTSEIHGLPDSSDRTLHRTSFARSAALNPGGSAPVSLDATLLRAVPGFRGLPVVLCELLSSATRLGEDWTFRGGKVCRPTGRPKGIFLRPGFRFHREAMNPNWCLG